MRRMTKSLCGVALLVGAPGAAMADSTQAWRADGTTDGVQVDRRAVPGSSFEELRLTTKSSSSLSSLCDAIYPPVLPSRPERRFKKQELLRETATDRWTYEQIRVSVFSDRDYVIHVTLEQGAATGHCSVSFHTEDDPAHPPRPGLVRIPVIRGHWDVSPTGGGQFSVQYLIFSEPGGGVPAFLARGGQRAAAIDFMKIILARATVPGHAPAPPPAPAPS